MEEEKWLPVVGYEGLYEVSDFGRIRGVDRVVERSDGGFRRLKGRIKRLIPTVQGYLIAHLSRDNEQISRGIHRLVLIAFVGPPPFEGAEANHKDFDKSNNKPCNLEWVTHQENMNHACANDRAKPMMGIKVGPKNTLEVVLRIREMAAVENLIPREISLATGVTVQDVWAILSNKSWKTSDSLFTPRRGSAALHRSKARKLTLEQVRTMRAMYSNGARQVDLAAMFNIRQGTVSAIIRNRIWTEDITSPSEPVQAL